MCVSYVFGGPQALEATIIIGVLEARCAYFMCLEALRRLKPLRGPTGGPGTSSSGSNIGSRGTVAE